MSYLVAAYSVCWGLIGLYLVILGGRIAALSQSDAQSAGLSSPTVQQE